jgi:methyl-accepting chemotaxis protein
MAEVNEHEVQKPKEMGPRRPYLPWWRRNYMVNRELQLKYAGSALIMGIVCSLSSFAILLVSFWSFGIWQGQRLPFPVIFAIIVSLLVNLAGIMVTNVLSTQRIVGPLFNLLKQFQRVARGDFRAHAKFRANDEIHYVARRFNEMLNRLEERDNEMFEHLEKATQALRDNQHEEAMEAINHVRTMRMRALSSAEGN